MRRHEGLSRPARLATAATSVNPTVSVLLPVYNGGAYLREALGSLLKQTLSGFEIIALYEPSKDDSLEILQACSDSRLVVREIAGRKGLAHALNVGLDSARGKYVARMDCDDVSVPGRLKRQIEFMEQNPEVGVCGSWIRLFSGDDHVKRYPATHEAVSCGLLFECCLAHPSVMMRREVFEHYGLRYDVRCAHGEDYDLWTRCAKLTRLANIPEVLVLHRWHPEQKSSSGGTAHMRASSAVGRRYLSGALGVELEGSAEVYDLLVSPGLVPSMDRLVEAHRFLLDLRERNRDRGAFREQELSALLADRWRFVCRGATAHGAGAFRLYWGSELRERRGGLALWNLKLLIKCLLRLARI